MVKYKEMRLLERCWLVNHLQGEFHPPQVSFQVHREQLDDRVGGFNFIGWLHTKATEFEVKAHLNTVDDRSVGFSDGLA
jgi:hypothetical protein